MYKKLSRIAVLSMLALASTPALLFSQQPQVQQAPQANDQNSQATAAAANVWLNLVDQGKYGESWDAASLTFQFTIPRNEWIKAMTIARQPLGNAQSRELIRQDPAQNPKDLPAGAYMVIYYKTSFSNRPNAHERLIMQQQNNGQWKMLTYDVS